MANNEFEKMALVHNQRLQKGRRVLIELDSALNELQQEREDLHIRTATTDDLLSEAQSLLASLAASDAQIDPQQCDIDDLLVQEEVSVTPQYERRFERLEMISFDGDDDWDALFTKHSEYAQRHNFSLDTNLSTLLSWEDIETLNKRIDEDFTYKNANCDKYDYMIAGTAGVLGAMIDIFLVGAPGEGKFAKRADDFADGAVRKFASACGWDGPRDGSDPTKSAIGFLERKYTVNYDHRHSADVGGRFTMSTKNHHLKSLAHSPDLIGLFFSILGQFTDTAHFVDEGKIITIDTESFKLHGKNFVAKIYCGFSNWLGHLFSDVAGSSGAQGRGAGIPMPFYSLTQFLDFGEFGQYRQTFATVCRQVFEQGYDLRHGMALAVPVVVTELLIRIMFFVKQHFYHKKSMADSLPKGSIPELRRMLLVGHGTLCVFDAGDAALRSGGNMVKFLLRTNLIAWGRFGSLAIKELTVLVKQGHIDADRLDSYLESEYQKMLAG